MDPGGYLLSLDTRGKSVDHGSSLLSLEVSQWLDGYLLSTEVSLHAGGIP